MRNMKLIWTKLDDLHLDYYAELINDHVKPGMLLMDEPMSGLPDAIFIADGKDMADDGVALYGLWLGETQLGYICHVMTDSVSPDLKEMLTVDNYGAVQLTSVIIDVPMSYLWNAVKENALRGNSLVIIELEGPGGGNPCLRIRGTRSSVIDYMENCYLLGSGEPVSNYIDDIEDSEIGCRVIDVAADPNWTDTDTITIRPNYSGMWLTLDVGHYGMVRVFIGVNVALDEMEFSILEIDRHPKPKVTKKAMEIAHRLALSDAEQNYSTTAEVAELLVEQVYSRYGETELLEMEQEVFGDETE